MRTLGIIFVFIVTILTGCDRFFDVKPKDRYLQERVFSSRNGVMNALNGIYGQMAEETLYGNTLTMGAMDVMGQYYEVAPDHQLHAFSVYQYQEKPVEQAFDKVWRQMYAVILNVNSFIQNLRMSNGVVDESEKRALLGEAYGLRAFLHADLLRLYGPVFSEDPSGSSIPYYFSQETIVQPFLSAEEAASRIFRDIDTARSLLPDVHPPVLLQDKYRLNAYAINMLAARMELYRGHTDQAFLLAEQLIEERGSLYLLDKERMLSMGRDSSRLQFSETVFMLRHATLERQYRNLFDPTLPEEVLLSPDTPVLVELFENNFSDPYLLSGWEFNFVPATITRRAIFIRFRQPGPNAGILLLGLPELYLIAAEAAPDEARRLYYINAFLSVRGMQPVATDADLMPALYMAFRREVWGHGQFFFYLKRNNIRLVRRGNPDRQNIVMTGQTYRIPVPRSEWIQR